MFLPLTIKTIHKHLHQHIQVEAQGDYLRQTDIDLGFQLNVKYAYPLETGNSLEIFCKQLANCTFYIVLLT